MAFSQSKTVLSTSANSEVLTWDTATAGGTTIIAGVMQWGTASRDYSFTDSAGNTYTKLTKSGANRHVQISYCVNADSATTITNAVDTASGQNRTVWAIELDNAATFDVESTFDNASDVTAHHCAAVGAIDTAAQVFIVACSAANADFTSGTPETGFTELTDNGFGYSEYGYFSGAQEDQRCTWDSVTSRQTLCACASFADPASGVTPHWFLSRR